MTTTKTHETTAPDPIEISGARVHNLKDVTVTVPAKQITVVVGVSGSGKSSLAFGTLAVEAQRQLNSTFPWFIRNQMPKHERPDVDQVTGLTTPIVIDQHPLGGGSRSTVGTITDTNPMLRALFARHAKPSARPVSAYSFNTAQGMCQECDGLGEAVSVNLDTLLDRSKSLDAGAILYPPWKVGSVDWQMYAKSGKFKADKPLAKFTETEWETFLHGSGFKVELATKSSSFSTNYEGIVDRFNRYFVQRDQSEISERTRKGVEPFISQGECPSCGGARLNAEALGSKLDGLDIAQCCDLAVADLIVHIEGIGAVARRAASGLLEALGRIETIGLGYLSLSRATSTLSGGEGQRLKLVRNLGCTLEGLTYFFDEPTIGLHPEDVSRLGELLVRLRDAGNTVVVVEHDPAVMALADHLVELGPAAGVHGGQIVFEGTPAQLRKADTLTGAALRESGRIRPPRSFKSGSSVSGVTRNNLDNVSVTFPDQVLTAVTGVAGSGKSSLMAAFAADHDLTHIGQGPISASSRSTPTTFLGIMDPIRKLFAKESGEAAGAFSFNSDGACDECGGRGILITELTYMEPVEESCSSCEGRRFRADVLKHQVRHHNIAEVLELSVEDALEFFTEKPIHTKLETLASVGLGYLTLGQPLSSLSGGERQRIKLAAELGGKETAIYLLDEPTTGLHPANVDTLIAVLDRLVEDGNTVVVIEHNLDVVAAADWVVDLGPGGGAAGGRVVFEGTPADLLDDPDSVTAQHLRKHCA